MNNVHTLSNSVASTDHPEIPLLILFFIYFKSLVKAFKID